MADGLIDRRVRTRMSWPAIFAGTFVFLAIEVTFGMLGMAVFSSAANPSTTHAAGGMSPGAGIWLVILSIIALYFGGRAAAALSGTINSHVGLYHGLVTFGVSVFTSLVAMALMLGSTTMAAASTITASGPARVEDVIGMGGYWLFLALILGMIAAAIGGSQAVTKQPVARIETQETPGVRRIA